MTIKTVISPTTTEEYNRMQQYNITRYLGTCYEKGIEPSAELMANVDFSEIGFKEVVFYSQKNERYPVTVNETLAVNCVTTLPFEAYEKFITAEWLKYTKNHEGSLANVAIYHRNLPLLEKLHDLCLEKALEGDSNDPHSNSIHSYNRDFLEPVSNICHALKNDYGKNPIEDDRYAEGYLKLVKKVVCETDFFSQMTFFNKKQKPLKYSKNPDWTKVAISRYTYDNYRSIPEKAQNNLLGTLASQKGLTLLFQEALVHMMKKSPKEIKKYLGLESFLSKNSNEKFDNILSRAFAGENMAAAKIIIESFGLTQQDCLTAYENNIKDEINRLKNYSEEGMSFVLKKHFNENYQSMKKEFFPDLETQYLSLFALGTDEKFKQSLLENKDFLDKHVSSKDVITINECLLLAKTVSLASEILSQEGKKLAFRDDSGASNRKDLLIYISEHIYKTQDKLMENIDYQSLSDKYWSKMFGRMDDFVYLLKIEQGNKKEVVTHDLVETLFKAAKLNGLLNVQEKNPANKKKLKI